MLTFPKGISGGILKLLDDSGTTLYQYIFKSTGSEIQIHQIPIANGIVEDDSVCLIHSLIFLASGH